MIRVRFEANEDDFRPVTFPPPGPYWCSGYGNDHAIVVAYLENEDQIKEFWPEARNVSFMQERNEITFTDRFARPDWWPEGKLTLD
jgi:hypothetical protein